MTAFIGITQDMAAAEVDFSSRFNETMGEKTVVGPFASHEAASDWLHFMLNRTTNCQPLDIPATPGNHTEWYGLTFQNTPEN